MSMSTFVYVSKVPPFDGGGTMAAAKLASMPTACTCACERGARATCACTCTCM
jgi:hypothetical protein